MKYLIYLLLFISFTARAQDKGLKPVSGGVAPAGTERRLALVIGNKDYQRIRPLKNPLNDAADMSRVLNNLGFEVITVTNASFQQLTAGLNRFKDKLTTSDVALLYYSGHGVSYGGKNYLLPVDADIRCLEQVEEYGIALNRILSDLASRQVRNSFVFLDACRNLPELAVCDNAKRDLTTQSGLVKPTNNPRGSMVVFATDEGSTADDNASGRNGLFTEALLKYLAEPNISIRTILDKTSLAVEEKSGQRQSPGRYDKLHGDFVFVQTATQPNQPAVVEPVSEEPVKPAPVARTDPGNSTKRSERAKHNVDLEPVPMVYVEGGTFQMGSPGGEADEKPVHLVTVSSFRMATTETTVAQYRRYCDEIGIKMPDDPPGGWHDTNPIVNVNWEDVIGFCEWLTRKTGLTYRLPTEAEWEYTARGGKISRGYVYAGSNSASTVSWTDENNGGKTHSVGQKLPNELGLYDLSGNAWEWCGDWYGAYSYSSQINPTGPSSGRDRVLRGGSLYNIHNYCRSAGRYFGTPAERRSRVGFRVVSQLQ